MLCRPAALLAYSARIPGDHAATVECTTGWYWVEDALADDVDLHLTHAKAVVANDGESPFGGVARRRSP